MSIAGPGATVASTVTWVETVFGLPTHVLAVHAPVVLLPAAALVSVLFATMGRWRRRAGWWWVGAVVVVLVAVGIARQSGLQFDEALAGAVDVSVHRRLGDQTLLLTAAWLLLTLATVAVDRVAARTGAAVNDRTMALSADVAAPTRDASSPTATGLAVVTATVAVVATVWLARTGHEGAYQTWRTTVENFE